eukprot:TRINITY_DN5454_c0_g1_i1.p1 TRINITY_DN5454_c0_g1~~TRINITY_DN5454_c0_g1_i1.p1  ORF type:complete len:147 (+),score=31.63 TRINITY_DN5454_c0_g1_i1:39-443(+)
MSSLLEGEDASRLKLGPDFQEASCLLYSEVAILLEHRLKSSDTEPNPVFMKTLQYVRQFDRYKDKNVVRDIRSTLEKKGLRQYEIAALANLSPATAEEAKVLIPTLADGIVHSFTDDEITAMLNSISSYKLYQV